MAVGRHHRGSEARALRVYVDASGLVKLVRSEPGSPEMRRIWAASEEIVCLSLGYVEGHSAIARRLPSRLAPAARDAFDDRWADIETVAADDHLIALAAATATTYRLRTLDSLHLAAAMRVGGELTFVTWDTDLVTAARDAGFATAPA